MIKARWQHLGIATPHIRRALVATQSPAARRQPLPRRTLRGRAPLEGAICCATVTCALEHTAPPPPPPPPNPRASLLAMAACHWPAAC